MNWNDPSVLLGAFLPLGVAALILLVAWRPWKPAESVTPSRAGRVGSTVALALGCVAGQIAINGGIPPFPPLDVFHWIFYLTLGALLFCLPESIWNTSLWLHWTTRIVVVAAILWTTLFKYYQDDWDYMQAGLWTNGLAAVILAMWASHEALARRDPGSFGPFIFLVVGIGASVGMVLTGNVLLGRYMGAMASAVGACLVFSWFTRGFTIGYGGVGVFTTVLSANLIINYFYGYGEWAGPVGIALAAAPSAVWIGETPIARRMTPRGRRALGLACVCIVVAIGVAMGIIDFLGARAAFLYSPQQF